MAVLLVVLLQICDPVLMLVYKIEQVSLQIQLFKKNSFHRRSHYQQWRGQVEGVTCCPVLVLAYTGVYTGSISPDRASALPT